MDQITQLVVLTAGIAGVAGILASLAIVRRGRPKVESTFAASTEGEKRCPKCGMGNIWTERQCSACGADLAG
jgi:hypothetical protein